MSSPTHKESLMRRIFAKLFGPSKREKEATEKIVACIRRKRKARALAASGTAILAALTSCAMPAADQGQGGSTGATPMIVVNIGTGGGVETTNTSAPTAAPASSASSAQSATNDVKPAVGDSAIKAATGVGTVEEAVKTLSGDGTVVPPKPETPAPATPEVK